MRPPTRMKSRSDLKNEEFGLGAVRRLTADAPGSTGHPNHATTLSQSLASSFVRGVVEYNPASRAKPPRLVRESSGTPVFEEAASLLVHVNDRTRNSALC